MDNQIALRRLNIGNIVIRGKKLKVPFELFLDNNRDHNLKCSQLLRFVPGRRAVFEGFLGGKKIIAKFFFKPFRYKNHVKKEVKGNNLFHKVKIPTSKILYSSFCEEVKSHILIFEFIEHSTSLREIFETPEFDNKFENWQELNKMQDKPNQGGIHSIKDTRNLEDTRRKHLLSLMRLIAKIHENGIIHNDLHPDNFLLKNDIIYALDGASIELKSTQPLKKEESLKNLAIIFSQINSMLYKTNRNLLYDFANAYAKERNFKKTDLIVEKLTLLIKKSHSYRVSKYLKKIYRRSTQIVCKKSFSSFILCQRKYYTDDMQLFLQNPDIAFHNPGNSLLKKGNTATLVRYQIDGKEFVVKRYNMKNRFHALRIAFKKSRADISWRSAHLLIKNQINTPKPVALKEVRFGPFKNKAFFICEYIMGESARDFFLDISADKNQILAKLIIGQFSKLKSLKITHGDMKATNIIIHNDKPFFIDLDSMIWHKSRFMFSYAWKKDINRFMRNWNNIPQTARLFKKLQ